MKSSWLRQIVTIENKGYAAFVAGKKVTDVPYKNGGGSVQRQRRLAWQRGWKLAERNLGTNSN